MIEVHFHWPWQIVLSENSEETNISGAILFSQNDPWPCSSWLASSWDLIKKVVKDGVMSQAGIGYYDVLHENSLF